MLFILGLILDIFFYIVVSMNIYFTLKFRSFRERIANKIILHMLISDLFLTIFYQYKRAVNITQSSNILQCTIITVFISSFINTSSGFLLYFCVERYVKVSSCINRYIILFNEKKVRLLTMGVWVLVPFLSVIMTLDWDRVVMTNTQTHRNIYCLNSIVMDPICGILYLIFSSLIPLVALMVINLLLWKHIRNEIYLILNSLKVSYDVKIRNRIILRNVKIRLIIATILFMIIYVGNVVMAFFVIVTFMNNLEMTDLNFSDSRKRITTLHSIVYPLFKAIISILLNPDFRKYSSIFVESAKMKIKLCQNEDVSISTENQNTFTI